MDSNMNYIKEDQFWPNTFKLKCGRAELLEEKLKNYDFSNATHIILGTGTNDIANGTDASTTFQNLKEAAEGLACTYRNTNVYVTQLPPMGDESCNMAVQELNNYIKENLNTNITSILQENITQGDMYDPKHILIKSVGKYVKNMKDAIRNVLKYNVTYTENKDRNVHNQSNRDMKYRQNPGTQSKELLHPEKQPENDMVALMIKTIQQSNENMILGLKNSFLSMNSRQ